MATTSIPAKKTGGLSGQKFNKRFTRKKDRPRQDPKILFQQFFKSVGPRTYAAQVKECSNGNHLLVLTEGKRDEETGEVRKTRLFVYSEDFEAMFGLLRDAAKFIRANPVPPEVAQQRKDHWAKQAAPKQRAAPGASAA